jgi:hypothetical protein
LRDAVELEWAGIPSVAVIHESQAASARAMARVSAMGDYPFVTVDYPHVPLGVWPADEVRQIAKEVASAVADLLTRPATT